MKLKSLVFCLFLVATGHLFPDNLIENPAFEDKETGWHFWMRETGKGKAAVVYDADRKNSVLYIEYSGLKDWSYFQGRAIPVEPGSVYAFGGLIKTQAMDGECQLSVVLYDKDDQVIDWLYGLRSTGGTRGWEDLSNRIIIPRGCNSIRFRITGGGRGRAFFDDLSLEKIKAAPPKAFKENETISIKKNSVSFRYSPAQDLVEIGKGTKTWRIKGFGASTFVAGAAKPDAGRIRFSFVSTGDGFITAEFAIADDGILVRLSAPGELTGDFEFPGTLLAQPDESWALPANEGLLIPSLDPFFSSWDRQFYGGHSGFSMPFIGLTDGSAGMIVIVETPDDVKARYLKPAGDTPSGWSIIWEPSHGAWGYERKLKIRFTDNGYVGIAKAYRSYAKKKGLLVTLKEKAKITPQVDRLVGAVDLWWWKKAEYWSHDLDCGQIATEMKKAGIEKVLWSNQASAASIRIMNELGYLTGRYDIYQDVWGPEVKIPWVNHEGWPEALVLEKDGTWKKGWVTRDNGKEYPGGVICSQPGLAMMKKNVRKELAEKPYRARFIDTTTASPLSECYNPKHPLTRSGDRKYKSALLGSLFKEFKLVTGSETGIDWAVPFLHYFEGMMSIATFRLPDSGYDLTSYKKPDADFLRFQTGQAYRIPLFELVYHDCVVSYWYWGDSSNRIPELWDVRDLSNLLYGTGPLWIVDPDRWKKDQARFIQSYRTACKTAELTAYAEMTDHRFISPDRAVQYTAFSNGVKVWVNFGNRDYTLPDGALIKAKGFLIRGDK